MNISKEINDLLQSCGITSYDFAMDRKKILNDLTVHPKIKQLFEFVEEMEYLIYSSGDQMGEKGKIHIRLQSISKPEIILCDVCKIKAIMSYGYNQNYCKEHFERYEISGKKYWDLSNINYEMTLIEKIIKINSIFPIKSFLGGGSRFGSWFWIIFDGISIYDYYYDSMGKPKELS